MAPQAMHAALPSVQSAERAASPPEPGSAGLRGAGRLSASVARHQASIRALCDEVERPFDELAAVYHCELARLSAIASVTDYLPVLVAKRVRALYRHRMEALQQGDPCAQLIGHLA